MTEVLAFTILGLATGSIYAVAASGLVVTYTTSGIFNFAHGAVGMFMAFVFWELRFSLDLPAPLALFLVVLVFAPLMGAVIERVLMRNLHGSSTGTSLVVTIGLMVFVMGIAQTLWPPAFRPFPHFFGSTSGVRLAGALVTYHEIMTVLVAAAVAGFFWFLLTRTRTGTAMRAVVDDRGLASLNGASPGRLGMLSWAMGSSVAAIAGILIAPLVNLEILNLTLLIVPAYAAAVFGRLRNLPLTFAGAMILGLLQAYLDLRWLPTDRILGLREAMPMIMLFVVLLVMREERLRVGRLVQARGPRVPSFARSVQGGALLVAVAIVLSFMLSDGDLVRVGEGLALAVIMLSLVVLTGYGGQVSLAQMTFVGVGAFAMAQFGATATPLGLILAPLLAAPLGALVALPALRLQGLYLALATAAFAVLAQAMLFPQSCMFGTTLKQVPRPEMFASEQGFFILLALAFAVLGILVLALRRGRFGRLVSAMRDSPSACSTLGVNLVTTKVGVFALSAAMAGFAGALYGGLRGSAQTLDFIMFRSLPLLLMAVIGGITTVSGALVGGLMLGALFAFTQESIQGLVFLVTGAAAISLGRNPHGVAFFLYEQLTKLRDRLASRRGPSEAELDKEVKTLVAASR
jgi:branched-chain amino acid transport system permease protein